VVTNETAVQRTEKLRKQNVKKLLAVGCLPHQPGRFFLMRTNPIPIVMNRNPNVGKLQLL
jgi:nitrogenase subunit NifH